MEQTTNHIHGFLRAQGTKLVNDDGAVLLTGWGLGNWLLCEGYMWLSGDAPSFDRPRKIEAAVRDMTGSAYAAHFWQAFRQNYVTRADIFEMAACGYNSVRIPMNWRVFMEDEPEELLWKEEGFALLDACIGWCKEAGLYAFLDLHGAPGGQTGANIDDSLDNLPRLLMDKDYWNKALALWEKLAQRYADEPAVGGYDLLNEPIRPQEADPLRRNMDYLVPQLAKFYEEATAVIRAVDKNHLLSIEGHHWATANDIFYKKYDENMIVHFHRYGMAPDLEAYRPYLALREQWQVPLWLGETGENLNEWYAAMYPLATALDIGYNLWPWKKMDSSTSPFSVNRPDGWEVLVNYTKGGPKPTKATAIALLDAYLENMKLENCTPHPAVHSAVFRKGAFTLRGSDFDELPGAGQSYQGKSGGSSPYAYRQYTGMRVQPTPEAAQGARDGWHIWNDYGLTLSAGEFACYTANHAVAGSTLTVRVFATQAATITLTQNGQPPQICALVAKAGKQELHYTVAETGKLALRVGAAAGTFQLDSITFGG
ncbi:MAG: cellulase family glycosylhydrolase [Gemmiger sp.]|nr:cellulase family glycosylhydrolase [Gemmiger sp.]